MSESLPFLVLDGPACFYSGGRVLDRRGEGRGAASVQDTIIPAIGLDQEEERRAFMLPLQLGRLSLRGFIFLRGLPGAFFQGPSGACLFRVSRTVC